MQNKFFILTFLLELSLLLYINVYLHVTFYQQDICWSYRSWAMPTKLVERKLFFSLLHINICLQIKMNSTTTSQFEPRTFPEAFRDKLKF